MELCSDIKIQIKFVLNNKTIKKMKLVSLNPDNYKVNSFYYSKNSKKKNTSFKKEVLKSDNKHILPYFKLFDIYMENCLLKILFR